MAIIRVKFAYNHKHDDPILIIDDGSEWSDKFRPDDPQYVTLYKAHAEVIKQELEKVLPSGTFWALAELLKGAKNNG